MERPETLVINGTMSYVFLIIPNEACRTEVRERSKLTFLGIVGSSEDIGERL